jgi:antigen flippase
MKPSRSDAEQRVSLASRSRSVLRLAVVGLTLRGGQSLISLLNVLVLARVLGPSGRGEYFLFVAAVAVLARFADFGMSSSGVVFASRYPDALASIHRKLVWLLAGLWLVSAAVGWVVLTLFSSAASGLPVEREWLALGVLPLAMYEQIWIHLMVGMQRVVAMNLVQIGAGFATLLLNVGLVVLLSGGVSVAVWIYCGVLLIKIVVMLLLAVRFCGPRTSAPSPTTRELLSFGVRGYPNAVAALLWTRLPAFVLDITHGTGSVGVFSIAQQVLEQLMLPIQATQDAIYQRLARLPRVSATAEMNRYLRLGVWGMLPFVVVCGVLAPWGVPLVLSSAFERSALVFQVLLVSALASVVPALLSPYFFGHLQRPGLASTVAWVRVLLALLLSLILAPAFAELGVAAALAIADTSSTLLILGLYVRIARTSILDVLLPRALLTHGRG